jgi:hypothetical protein
LSFSGAVFFLSYPTESVLESRIGLSILYEWFGLNLWRFPPGIYFCGVGLLFVSAFTFRLHLGLSLLPISFELTAGATNESAASWDGYKRLILVLLGPYFLIAGLFGFLLNLPYLLVYKLSAGFALHQYWFTGTLGAFLVVGLLFLFLGKDEKRAARQSVQLVELRRVFLAFLLPIGISLLCAALPYVVDRIQWAAYHFGKTTRRTS